jgi:hypothetical protein
LPPLGVPRPSRTDEDASQIRAGQAIATLRNLGLITGHHATDLHLGYGSL